MNYDLDLVEIPVSIGGVKYTLREATGHASAKYRNAQLAATRLGPDGKPQSFENLADTELLLVSLCMFDAEDKPVPLNVVRAWPSRIIKPLFDKCKEISGMNDDEGETAKNSRSGLMDG